MRGLPGLHAALIVELAVVRAGRGDIFDTNLHVPIINECRELTLYDARYPADLIQQILMGRCHYIPFPGEKA